MELVVAFVMALAKLAAIRRPESPLATFVNVRLRTNATDMRTRRQSCDMTFRGARKAPNPSGINGIYG